MQCTVIKAPCIISNFLCKLWQTLLDPDFCCFCQVTMTKQGHTVYGPCSAIYTKTLPTRWWHGMQIEDKIYHICFANPHWRHGKRQALERPVLGNLSKGREAGYKKDSPIITGSCSMSVGLDYTLIVTNITVIPSWCIVISVPLLTLGLPWL